MQIMRRVSIFLVIIFIISTVCMPITYGETQNIALKQNRTVWGCGINEYSQLGNSTTINRVKQNMNFCESITVIPTVHGIDWKQAKLDSITVTIIYGNEVHEKRKTYSFEYDGNIIKTWDKRPFKVPLQYDQNNKPIYEYSYSIVAEFSNGIPKFNSGLLKSSSTILCIGPLNLNLLCVSIQASSTIDWEQIRSISIDIECQDVKVPLIELDKNNTKRVIEYPIGYKPNENSTYNYKYTVTYNMQDGCFKTISNSNQVELVIPSFTNEKVVYTFMADEDPTIKNIFLTLEYEDNNSQYRKQLAFIDIYNCKDKQYNWVIPVIDSRSGDAFFSGSIVYNDGSPIKQIPRTKASTNHILVHKSTPKFELDIIPLLIDWNKFVMAIITLEYKDEDNKIYYRTNRKFVKNSRDQKWVINIADKAKSKYTWSGQFITADHKVYKIEPSTNNSDYLLIIPPQI